MGILSEITGTRVYVDTSPFIFYVEAVPPYVSELTPLFDAFDAGTLDGVTGEITLAECLVKPLKDGNVALESAFQLAVQDKAHFQVYPIDRALWIEAARIRSKSKLKLPDAVHLATAEQAGCTTFVTNDTDFRGATSMKVVVLSELITP